MNIIDKLAHWWIARRLKAAAAAASRPGMEFTQIEITPDGMAARAISPAVATLAAEATAMLERGKVQNYIQFDMCARAGTPPVRVTVAWAHGVSPAFKAHEMQEALKDMVQQHCLLDDGQLHGLYLSANEAALTVLDRYKQVQPMPQGRFVWSDSMKELAP